MGTQAAPPMAGLRKEPHPSRGSREGNLAPPTMAGAQQIEERRAEADSEAQAGALMCATCRGLSGP